MDRQLGGGGLEVTPERMCSGCLSERGSGHYGNEGQRGRTLWERRSKGADIMETKVKGDGHYGNEGQRGWTLWERRSNGTDIMGTKVKGVRHYGNKGEMGRTLWERRSKWTDIMGTKGKTLRERRSKGMEAADDGWVNEGEGPFSKSHSVYRRHTEIQTVRRRDYSQCFILCLLTAR